MELTERELMRKTLILIPLLAAMLSLGRAQDITSQPILIDATDKAALDAAIGKDVVVQGIVASAAWSGTGSVMTIEFKNARTSRFTAVIFQRNRAKIDDGFAGDVTKALAGAKVRIRGKLEMYAPASDSSAAHPEIIITLGDQITILEASPATRPGT